MMKNKNRYFTLLALGVFTLLGVGCNKTAPTFSLTPRLNPAPGLSPTPTPGNPKSGAITYAVQADGLLSSNLYQSYQSQSGNIFFSPFSILTAMAMAQEGANGPTAAQMQAVLGLNSDPTIRRQGFQQLIAQLNRPGKSYTLDIADNLWVQQNFPILASYFNTVQTYYDAGVANVDFGGNPTGALQTINGAVSQETAGYIPNLLSPSDVPLATKLVLTNAIYFQANWKSQFETYNTALQNFYLPTGKAEPVSMMNQPLPAVIGDFNGVASVLALPYQNNEASMYIFLPPRGGMAALEGALGGNNIPSWLAANAPALTGPPSPSSFPLALSLPKFTFKTSYSLANTLSQMGMPLAFTGGAADFSGIDGARDLYISAVIHQAFINVDELGTTAAAATGVVAIPMAVAMTTGAFTVDHPFIFMIVENTTNTVLFMGRVDDPLSTN